MTRAALLALAVLCAAPAGAETPAARAIANLLLASDMAEACSDVVRRRGPQDREAFIIEGIRILNGDCHSLQALDDVNRQVSAAEMSRLQDAIFAERGLVPGSRSSVCGFAQQMAGQNDTIGRFLERVQ